MSALLLLPVKPGSLSTRDRAALRKAGVIVIEHEAPHTLRLLRPTAGVDSSEMLACAVHALSLCPSDTHHHSATKQREAFIEGLSAILAMQSKVDQAVKDHS